MAKTLFIVDDEVFQGLPDPARKKLVDEVTDLFSFVPGFTVKTLQPLQFPGTVLHFTDSVVSLIEQDIDMDAVLRDIRKRETANVQASIRANNLNLTINTPPQSFAGTQEVMGVGGQWKTVTNVDGKKVSIGMTYGVASLESAEEAFLEEFLHGRKADDIRAQRKDK